MDAKNEKIVATLPKSYLTVIGTIIKDWLDKQV